MLNNIERRKKMESKKISKPEPKKKVTRYPDTIKTKAIQLYREGKAVSQIIEEAFVSLSKCPTKIDNLCRIDALNVS